MLFSYVSGQQRIGSNRTCRRIAGHFDCHVDAAVLHGVYHQVEHIQGFTWSHWMPPSGECLRCIALAAAKIGGFFETTLNTNKTQLLPSNYGTFRALVGCENFNPNTDPLLSSSMRQASCKCKTPQLELKSSRTFLAIKHCEGTKIGKVIKQSQSSIFKLAHICATRGIPVNKNIKIMIRFVPPLFAISIRPPPTCPTC